MMKKKIIIQCLQGGFIGLSISYLISIVISLLLADGHFHAVAPALIEQCHTEMNAVLRQALGSISCGILWAGLSVIWEIDHWSLLRQTTIHLSIGSIGSFSIAYFMLWIDGHIVSILGFFGIFFMIYFIIWIVIYMITKNHIQQINDQLHKNQSIHQ